jgi:hypothetical protein
MSLGIGNARNSVFAIREESTSGQLVPINNAVQFVPLRPGFSLSRAVEELENEELRSGIGEARSVQGKETVTGEYAAYLKHSGVEGQEPETGILYESAFGEKIVNSVEIATVADSTTALIKVADSSDNYVGQALLIKDGANGFKIRNIKEISSNDLILNFPIGDAPAAGVNLGKAITYIPEADGFPTFSAWNYVGNGHAIVANSGNQTLNLSLEFAANQFANATFSFEGSNYRYNPIIIDAANKFIDFEDDQGVVGVSIPERAYNNPVELAVALQDAMNLATSEEIEVTYSNQSGKFTISTSTSTLFEILWDSGVNSANSIGETLGFDVSEDSDGATSYESDDAQEYESPITPAYDSADPLVVKDVEFLIGDALNNICRCATTATIEIAKETEDVDCICEETGTKGKIATQRTVTITAEIIIDKHDVFLFKSLKDSDSLQVMLNHGEKQGGNYVAGSCFNFYVPNAGITEFSTEGENFVVANVTVKGFVDNNKECFINFL